MADYPWNADAFKQYPTRVISGADILELQGTEKVLIGRTIAWCNDIENTCGEAIAKAERYYNRLIELGDIIPKKSTDEMLLEAMNAIKYLSDKVDRLEGEKNEHKSIIEGSEGSARPSKPRGGTGSGKPTVNPTSYTSVE